MGITYHPPSIWLCKNLPIVNYTELKLSDCRTAGKIKFKKFYEAFTSSYNSI